MAEEKGQIKKPMQKLFVETYIDIIFAASLNYYAIMQTKEPEEFLEFFNSFENLICTILTIVCLFLGYVAPIYTFSIIYRYQDNLQSPDILNLYGVYYEEYDYQSCERLKSYFTVISLVRRLVMI